MRSSFILCALAGAALLLAPLGKSYADPVSTSPRFSFAGNVDYVVTGGSLRTADNGTNACSVTNSDTAALTGIPAGSTVIAAYLYWAGSGPTIDSSVTLNGSGRLADRTFTETYAVGGFDLDFFSGFDDVTDVVSGNGAYTFADLSVTNTDLGGGANYCSSQTVLSGWGLVVVYSNLAEPFRVINLFDGFQHFRGSQITLTPNNFVIPVAPIDGKIGILSFEGDTSNSTQLNGITENVVFDGQSTAVVSLIDGLNPLNNQFNSTVNVTGSTVEHGVDFDVYDISPQLRAGDTSAQTVYSSGGDLVLLSAEIISVTNTPAVDLTLAKSHSGDFSTSATNRWALLVTNNGPSAETNTVSVTDTLPGGVTYQGFSSTDPSWNCTAVSQTVTCTHPGPLAAGASLAAVELEVDVDVSVGTDVTNSAAVSSTSFDFNAANNTASDTANVVVPILTSAKSVLDLNGGTPEPGDTLRYTITFTESAGAAVDGASFVDDLNALLTNLNVTNPAGGTDGSSATQVVVSDISVPAGGSTAVEFEVDIVAAATTGDVISNVAQVTNPVDGSVTDAAAPDLYVGGSGGPASGIKPIYLNDFAGSQNNPTLPMPMSRVAPTAVTSPERVRIRRQDNDRVWQLTPTLAAPLGLDGSAIPVTLQMRRNNNTSTRNVRVSISYSSGFFGCATVSIAATGAAGLSNSQTREFVVSVPRSDSACVPLGAAALTVPTGDALFLSVDNEPAVGPSGQAIFVYPYDGSTARTSRMELPATTVINVDDVDTFDAAFPAGTAASSFAPGDTAFLRAIVSDPFGTFDITAINYTLVDPLGATQASGSMAVVADSLADTVTGEASFTFAAGSEQGSWVLTVTALEGSEGTVQHTAQTALVLSSGVLVLEKFVTTVSDPVTGVLQPKAIPMAELDYTIRVTNPGTLAVDADTIVVGDSLPGEMRLYFGALPAPVQFQDGSPASGLTFTFGGLADVTDDVQFSNDGGSTFIVPSVDVNGFDSTSPKIDYVEIRPKGTFAGDSGSGAPSFELTLRMRLE